MEILNQKFLFVFFTSLAFRSDNERYTLQHEFDYPKYGTEYIQKWNHEHELSFKIPGIGNVKYATTYTSLHQYMGQEGEFYKFKVTGTDMETNNYVDGIEIIDQYWLAMEDNPCYIYAKIDGNGLIDHIKPVNPEHDYLLEAYEAAYMSLNISRYKYPFGSAAENIIVGDTWNSSYETSKFYVNLGSPPSLFRSRATWDLKKVKDKRGVKTAYIDVIDEITIDLKITIDFLGERQIIVGNAYGKSDAKFRWDIENTDILYSRTINNLKGDFEMDGETFFSQFYFRQTTKMVR